MQWLWFILRTTIGRKFLMAVTGAGFALFLVLHLAGNLTFFRGEAAFEAYAHVFESRKGLLLFFESGLLLFALVHVGSGLFLALDNFWARPVRYKAGRRPGLERYLAVSMPLTGLAILAYVVFHIAHFKLALTSSSELFELVVSAFSDPVTVGVYIAGLLVVALHLAHGFWSLFQTTGIVHPKYLAGLIWTGWAFSAFILIGFAVIPLSIGSGWIPG